eukprot:1000542_1
MTVFARGPDVRSLNLTKLFARPPHFNVMEFRALCSALVYSDRFDELIVSDRYLGDEGVESLSPILRKNEHIRSLVLQQTGARNHGFGAISSALSRGRHHLRRLRIASESGLTASVLKHLCRALANSRMPLASLAFVECKIGGKGFAHVVNLMLRKSWLSAVTSLDISGNQLGKSGTHALVQYLQRARALRSFCAVKSALRVDAVIEAIAGNKYLTSIRRINVSENKVKRKTIPKLELLLRTSLSLTHLALCRTGLDAEGVIGVIVAAMENESRRSRENVRIGRRGFTLALSHNSIGPKGAGRLLARIQQLTPEARAAVEELALKGVSLGPSGVVAVCVAAELMPELKTLLIGENIRNSPSDKSAMAGQALARLVRTHRTLRELSVAGSGGSFAMKGALSALFEELNGADRPPNAGSGPAVNSGCQCRSKLVKLDVRRNKLSQKSMEALFRMIRSGCRLRSLLIDQNGFDLASLTKLRDAITTNSFITDPRTIPLRDIKRQLLFSFGQRSRMACLVSAIEQQLTSNERVASRQSHPDDEKMGRSDEERSISDLDSASDSEFFLENVPCDRRMSSVLSTIIRKISESRSKSSNGHHDDISSSDESSVSEIRSSLAPTTETQRVSDETNNSEIAKIDDINSKMFSVTPADGFSETSGMKARSLSIHSRSHILPKARSRGSTILKKSRSLSSLDADRSSMVRSLSHGAQTCREIFADLKKFNSRESIELKRSASTHSLSHNAQIGIPAESAGGKSRSVESVELVQSPSNLHLLPKAPIPPPFDKIDRNEAEPPNQIDIDYSTPITHVDLKPPPKRRLTRKLPRNLPARPSAVGSQHALPVDVRKSKFRSLLKMFRESESQLFSGVDQKSPPRFDQTSPPRFDQKSILIFDQKSPPRFDHKSPPRFNQKSPRSANIDRTSQINLNREIPLKSDFANKSQSRISIGYASTQASRVSVFDEQSSISESESLSAECSIRYSLQSNVSGSESQSHESMTGSAESEKLNVELQSTNPNSSESSSMSRESDLQTQMNMNREPEIIADQGSSQNTVNSSVGGAESLIRVDIDSEKIIAKSMRNLNIQGESTLDNGYHESTDIRDESVSSSNIDQKLQFLTVDESSFGSIDQTSDIFQNTTSFSIANTQGESLSNLYNIDYESDHQADVESWQKTNINIEPFIAPGSAISAADML